LPSSVKGPATCTTTGSVSPKKLCVVGLDAHYVYNPEIDNWISTTPIPASRYSVELGVVDDILYAIGSGIGDNPIFLILLSNPRMKLKSVPPLGYIPEFPAWMILYIFLVVTLVFVGLKSKVFRPTY